MTPIGGAVILASLLAALALPLGLIAPWRRVAAVLGLIAAFLLLFLLHGSPRIPATFLAALPAAALLLAVSSLARRSLEQTAGYTRDQRREQEQAAAHHDRRLAAFRTRLERIQAQTISFDRLNRVAARYGTPDAPAAVEAITIDGAREILGGGEVRLEPVAANEPAPLPRRSARPLGRAMLSVPFETTGPRATRQQLIIEDAREWTTMDLRMLFSLAETAGVAYEIAALAEEVAEEARHDALTGLLLRRSFENEVEIRLALAHRAKRPCAVAMIDLDRFKSLNDTFGHAAGDEALRGFGVRAGRFLAEPTHGRALLIGRVGGEEFAVLAEEATPADLAAILDRLRASVAAECQRPDGAALTFSAGVAGYPQDAQDYAALALLADKALYHAKASGRNRVEVFSR